MLIEAPLEPRPAQRTPLLKQQRNSNRSALSTIDSARKGTYSALVRSIHNGPLSSERGGSTTPTERSLPTTVNGLRWEMHARDNHMGIVTRNKQRIEEKLDRENRYAIMYQTL